MSATLGLAIFGVVVFGLLFFAVKATGTGRGKKK